jgi:hypothetical protein
MKADKPKAAVKIPKVPKIPDTQEDLLLQIGGVITDVNAAMAVRTYDLYLNAHHSAFYKLAPKMADLVKRLEKLLSPVLPSPYGTDALHVIEETFGAQPGTVPSWAQPGTFLLWIGYVPCRCIWGGFASPTATVVAATTAEKWIVPSGAIDTAVKILLEWKTPADLFRAYLVGLTEARDIDFSKRGKPKDRGPKFNLHPLHELGVEAVTKTLEDHPWLVEELKRGKPADRIPLPPHLASVQMAWGPEA